MSKLVAKDANVADIRPTISHPNHLGHTKYLLGTLRVIWTENVCVHYHRKDSLYHSDSPNCKTGSNRRRNHHEEEGSLKTLFLSQQ